MEKVLVVDDEQGICDLLCRFLKSRGYEAAYAKDGDSALEMVESFRPNLVLLDIRMPGLSGMEILQILKESHPKLGVIMVTGVDDRDTGIASLGLGADDYITKPLDMDRLALAISVKLAMS